MNARTAPRSAADPQGWDAAVEVMNKAGSDRVRDAANALEFGLSRLSALLHAVKCLLDNGNAPLIDIEELIAMANEVMDDIGGDALNFVDDHRWDVTHAVCNLIAERDAAIQRASLPPVPPDQFANVLGEAIELALNKVGTPANQNKPVSKRKATAKGAA